MFRAAKGGGIMESIIEELYYGNITPAELPQNRRIRTYPAARHQKRRKASGDTDRSAERALRKVQGQHIGYQQYDGGNSIHSGLQAVAAADR